MKIKTAEELNKKYLREGMWPTIFCNGCGNGVILEYTFWAIEELGLNVDKVAFASGIGCSSRLPGYINADGLHTTHGRAIAFATGLKAANPELTVIVFTGDGDCAGIGGNHFIHAARRNIDMTVIMVNNFIYGMTGGQLAPTTPIGGIATTAPYGNIEHPFDLCIVTKALGASYVARWLVSHPYQSIKSIKKGIQKKGFSYIEFLSPCPTAYGRRNKLGDIKKLWEWYDKNTILIEDYERIMKYGDEKEKEETKKMIQIGVFQDIEKPEFFTEYQKLVEQLQGKKMKTPSAEPKKVVVRK
ncbi:MAG TPA: 2-oxoacid:ferredoxin oxidoreductase subunit beta [Thermoplasmata archaeon]|nr:2-oxoacid:ferredoxin oxidoreductase subunit beta [Thermoplasmata archaeon]